MKSLGAVVKGDCNTSTSCEGSAASVPDWPETANKSASCLLVLMMKQ